jgi:hypothetical protein
MEVDHSAQRKLPVAGRHSKQASREAVHYRRAQVAHIDKAYRTVGPSSQNTRLIS